MNHSCSYFACAKVNLRYLLWIYLKQPMIKIKHHWKYPQVTHQHPNLMTLSHMTAHLLRKAHGRHQLIPHLFLCGKLPRLCIAGSRESTPVVDYMDVGSVFNRQVLLQRSNQSPEFTLHCFRGDHVDLEIYTSCCCGNRHLKSSFKLHHKQPVQ